MRIAALVLLAAVARAESIPPGDYTDVGVVVLRKNFGYDLFNGYMCPLTLDEPLAKQLKPYLGKRIRLDYTRVDPKEGMLWDPDGAPIGKIRKITVLPEPDVRITVAKPEPFPFAGPIEVQVTIDNGSEFPLDGIECNLLRNYRSAVHMPQRKSVGPGRVVTLTIRAKLMAKPGRYDAVVHGTVNHVPVISALVPVEVREPANAKEEIEGLRAWLPRVIPPERVRIARRLIALGDRSGVDAVVELLPDRWPMAYRFVWKHGGENGERLLLDYLKHEERQDRALRIIEGVHHSPRAIPYLHTLLADRRELVCVVADWCENPRVCDITANWLAGYTDGKITFPNNGSLAERNDAVAAIARKLQTQPSRFSVLHGG